MWRLLMVNNVAIYIAAGDAVASFNSQSYDVDEMSVKEMNTNFVSVLPLVSASSDEGEANFKKNSIPANETIQTLDKEFHSSMNSWFHVNWLVPKLRRKSHLEMTKGDISIFDRVSSPFDSHSFQKNILILFVSASLSGSTLVGPMILIDDH